MAARLARDADTDRRSHIGYFLVDAGRVDLERVVHVRPTISMIVRKVARHFRLVLYLGAILGVTAAFTSGFVRAVDLHALPAWGSGLLLALLVLVSSHPAIAITNWALSLLVRPRALPRLDFSKGIPADHQTLVAVPTLLTDATEIDSLLEALEVRYLGNMDQGSPSPWSPTFGTPPQSTFLGTRPCYSAHATVLSH